MIDISTAGSSVKIDGVTITRFSDQGDPWSVEQLEVTGYGVTINNEVLVWAKPNAIVLTVNVLAGTPEYNALIGKLKAARVKGSGAGASAPKVSSCSATITLKTGSGTTTTNFSGGRILKGPIAGSSSADGRATSQPFSYVFEQMS